MSHTRRQFLRRAAFAGAGLALPFQLLADPYAPLPAGPCVSAAVFAPGGSTSRACR